VTTKDGSITFFNETYSESYHSQSGAKEEAVEKFVKPCRIDELAESGRINVLDVCFGRGYNSAALIDEAWKHNPGCRIRIIALENDLLILEKIKGIDIDFKRYDLIREAAEKHCVVRDNVEIRIIVGDARAKIKELDEMFDCVFLDPFSPKKCPELWKKEFFYEISKRMKKTGILSTYSCARIVRDNLKSAGFDVKDGPIVGRRAPGTVAFKV